MNEAIDHLAATAFTVPTDFPESDGTAEWAATTVVLVELGAGKLRGLGYSYAHQACVSVIRDHLFPLVRGKHPQFLPALWEGMNAAVRNFGRAGIAACAIAAVDIALWDLKAKLLGLPLVALLGARRETIPIYGSGGFTSYSDRQLRQQLEHWVSAGISMVKMKVGREPDRDDRRVKIARQAIGKPTALFVDANGAYTVSSALVAAGQFSEYDVTWFEEPVSSDDLAGLRSLRRRGPEPMEIAAGEYNYDLRAARRMLEAQAVDVLQADATRCGITGFLQMADLCEAFQIPLSAHTAPALHGHLCCAASRARHVEWFHDHARIEQLFFAGPTTQPHQGLLQPSLSLPGLGLEFKAADARKFQINA